MSLFLKRLEDGIASLSFALLWADLWPQVMEQNFRLLFLSFAIGLPQNSHVRANTSLVPLDIIISTSFFLFAGIFEKN
jgi:hypothetical protein